jgi:hypothetical protein
MVAVSVPALSAGFTSTINSLGNPDCRHSSSSPAHSSPQLSTPDLTLESLKSVLQNNPKTKAIDPSKGQLTIEERKRVIAVSTSRLVELHSLYPSTDIELSLASHLHVITGLPAAVFFRQDFTQRLY